MGEFKKIIKSLKEEEDFVNWGWGCEAIKLIESKVEEAKQEFPNHPWIDVNYNEQTAPLIRRCREISEWFVKYFGEKEEENK